MRLRELQQGFRRAMLAGDDAVAPFVLPDGVDAETRLDVYRTNVVTSLTTALRDTFPAVCRLVDERFFAYAAHEFMRLWPPRRPRLADYGGDFPTFLANFPPCQSIPYVADVARLEWAINVAANAPDAAPLAAVALAGVSPEDTPRLRLRLDPGISLITSPWPIERIWRANREPGAEEAIDLDAGGVSLEVRRDDRAPICRALDLPTFAFRQALWQNRTLEEAAEAALAVAADFDVTRAFGELFQTGAVTAFDLAPPTEEEPST